MPDEAQRETLDERRLALEERKWADEFSLRKIELEAKARENTLVAKLFSPLTATIMVAILTVGGSVTATLLQNANSIRLEQAKFDATKELEERKFLSSKGLETQKQQHELILKMIAVDNVEQANSNLRFLAETKLIADENLAQRLLAAKETPLIRPPSVQNLSTVLPSVTSAEFRRRISDDAIMLIIQFEGGADRESYEKRQGHAYAAGGGSGLIIGIGYDLGAVTPDKFREQWGPFLNQADADRLAAVVGLRGAAAAEKIQQLADIAIRWEDAVAVFAGSVLPEWGARLERSLPNARELPPDAYGALLSLVFNRGVSFATAGERFTEMRNIHNLMGEKKFMEIPGQLRAMKRLWSVQGLQMRREAEAKLFEKGLGVP